MLPDMTMIEIEHNGWRARFYPVATGFDAVRGYMDGDRFVQVHFVGSYATLFDAAKAARKEMM